ncbi:MAG: YdcF family protein [Eubacteriales bacterium]
MNSLLQFFHSSILFHILYCSILFFFVAFLFTFIIATFLIVKSANTEFPTACDAIIVLGAGLRNNTVSRSLASRLDTAYHCHCSYPNSVIVVSGGLGNSDTITEALAMKKYLLNEYNLQDSSVIIEDKSRRTLENFQFSKVLLDDYFQETYAVVYVTNDFHIYRSSKIALLTGIHAEGLSAPTAFYLLPSCYIREYLAIIKFYLKDFKK